VAMAHRGVRATSSSRSWANLAIRRVERGSWRRSRVRGPWLAETIHSFADCGNQILLLVGACATRAGRRPAQHPARLTGADVYFWSFMVAMLLFTGGGGLFLVRRDPQDHLAGEGGEGGAGGVADPEPFLAGHRGLGDAGATCASLNRRRGRDRRSWPTCATPRTRISSSCFGGELGGGDRSPVRPWRPWDWRPSPATGTGDGRRAAVAVRGWSWWAWRCFLAREVKSLLLGERADPDIDAAVAARWPAGRPRGCRGGS